MVMEAWLVVGCIVIALALLLKPYFDWRFALFPLESHVAKTSFPFEPGELAPAVWRRPEVSLSVIVPAYNEEYRLPQMLDETLTYLEGRAASTVGFSFEVVVVDDGSWDGTYAAARARAEKTRGELRVVQLASNHGKGFAVRTGMLVARGDLLLMADADGATRIRDLERLEYALERHSSDGCEIVFGSRHHLKDDALARRSFLRNVLMHGFHMVVWMLVGGPIHDTQCGFKLFRATAAKPLFSSLHLYRWAFDIELLIVARLLRKSVVEVPVTFTDMPGSKLNLAVGAFTMLRDIVAVRIYYALGIWSPVMM